MPSNEEIRAIRLEVLEECLAQRPSVYTDWIAHPLFKIVTEFFDVWLPRRIQEERNAE